VRGDKGMLKLSNTLTKFVQVFIGIRKMLIVLVFMGVGLTLLGIKWITGTEFITTTRDVVVAFMATNLAVHLAEAFKSWGKKNEKVDSK
jgi:hypothetical protein